ncbi:helix-turn-helix domain-containing protein [Arabiibacter massiliensis]|uniref:helix-turn-helix domain-containing protein n=1 Tax=Arabiibacter massiliensis TaxID=1870985 RepID=UPI00117A2926|nr:helix-turn-helix transcriptional regulator [Arabiibacter massiliensis]
MDIEEKRKRLGRNIQVCRKGNRLTQEQFALMVGMDRGCLLGIEAGKFNVSFDKLSRIAEGLNVTMAELLDGVDR